MLFDCDGVLVDSDASVLSAWTRWAVEFGLDPDQVTAQVHGRRSADTIAALLPPDKQVEATERIDRFEVEDAATVRAIPGAGELLRTVPRWAVVTSGRRDLARARLAAAGLPVPCVLVTAGDVARGKPDPEGYLAAAAGLGVHPGRTVVLEDAAAGIRAARAAGVSAVLAVGDRPELDGDARVPDLTRVRWTDDGLVAD
ncbi:MAG TPA: HAD-IA family hydrolase [Jatrophihabitans sp.]